MEEIIQIKYVLKFCCGEVRICVLLLGNWCFETRYNATDKGKMLMLMLMA